ncbi:MAG: hypothetical protein IT380_23210 [Myxococcales bacterium]|nr:hypothetical protein [Myxococcales bacterium]
MFSRRDRVELSVLGLLALGWALVISPVLHAVEHSHGHAHSHGAPAPRPGAHGEGSVEHGKAVFQSAPAMPVLVAVWQPLERTESLAPEAPSLASSFRPEQPQGP